MYLPLSPCHHKKHCPMMTPTFALECISDQCKPSAESADIDMHIHCTYVHNSYLTVIGVHSTMHLMHPNYCQNTILLVVDLCSSLAYFMMTQPLPIAGKLPIKTLVARQLPTNVHRTIYMYLHPHKIQYRWLQDQFSMKMPTHQYLLYSSITHTYSVLFCYASHQR